MKKTLGIIFLSLIVSACALSVEKVKENQTTCFTRADKNLHESIVNTGMDASNFDKYVEELKACQDKFQESDEEYLNEDYNKCVDRADRKHDRDSTRCDKKTNASERTRCQSQADKRHTNSTSSCERMGHSDNAAKIWGK